MDVVIDDLSLDKFANRAAKREIFKFPTQLMVSNKYNCENNWTFKKKIQTMYLIIWKIPFADHYIFCRDISEQRSRDYAVQVRCVVKRSSRSKIDTCFRKARIVSQCTVFSHRETQNRSFLVVRDL